MGQTMVTLRLLFGVACLLLAFDASAQAGIPPVVRVVEQAPIRRWLNTAGGDVLVVVEPGTMLDVLDKDGDWYWVVTPRDVHGTRRAGWIAARLVEAAVVPHEPDAPPTPGPPPEVSGVPAPEVISERPAAPENTARAEIVSAPRRYQFDDILFVRGRYSLDPEAVTILNAAASALGSDSLLRLTIEGHTCSLGTPAYNVALGQRRATAVRDYLVGQGVAPERLHTVSLGEERPTHDNTREATRALNRRVVLIPRDR